MNVPSLSRDRTSSATMKATKELTESVFLHQARTKNCVMSHEFFRAKLATSNLLLSVCRLVFFLPSSLRPLYHLLQSRAAFFEGVWFHISTCLLALAGAATSDEAQHLRVLQDADLPWRP